jgi:hypothetical protein
MKPPTAERAWRMVAREMDDAKADVRRMLLDGPRCTLSQMKLARDRFMRGHQEHGGDMWSWPASRFDQEIAEELIDAIIYRAAWRVIHRVPGDGTWH